MLAPTGPFLRGVIRPHKLVKKTGKSGKTDDLKYLHFKLMSVLTEGGLMNQWVHINTSQVANMVVVYECVANF